MNNHLYSARSLFYGTEEFSCLNVNDRVMYNTIMSPFGKRSAYCWLNDGKEAIKNIEERRALRATLVLLYEEFLND